jgi:RimJ/RimL family protein N-acetyltransferase
VNVIETDRLVLRTWKESDLLSFSLMNQDPMVMEFFPKTLSPGESAGVYHRITAFMEKHGFGLFAAEVKQTQQFIGFIGLSQPTFTSHFTPCIEIGWRLDRQFWNQGLATEGAKACLHYGFTFLHLKEIFSWTAKINVKSIHIMEKIGMRYEGDFEHPNVEEGHRLRTHVLYKSILNNI